MFDSGYSSRFIAEYYSRYPKNILGEHISVVRGVSYKPTDVRSDSDDGVAIILRSNNISEGEINYDDLVYVIQDRVQDSQRLQAGDIVMCGSNGSVSLIGKAGLLKKARPNTSFGAFCLGIKCKPTILPEYLNSFFNTAVYRSEIEALGNGTNIINIRPDNITNLSIPVPSIEEQTKFVSIVQQADKSKFSDFKSRFIAHFLNASYDKKRLGEVCCVISGKTIDLALENEGGPIAYLKVADLNLAENDRVVTASSRYVSEQTALTSGLVPIGATIFPKNGAAALHNKKRITSIITCVDMNTMAVYSKSDTVKPEYLYAFLESRDLATLALVGAIPQIRAKDVQALMIPVPNVEEQEEYITMMHQADKSKYLN